MSIEDRLEEIIRKVIREELEGFSRSEELELLTADQVAKLLNFTDRHAVYKLKREGKLKPVNLGDRTLRFSHTEVRRFIQACSQ